jgi:hypothetical protein
MKNKHGFMEISFAWLFAIIAGAVILFIAIFAATKIINLGQTTTSAESQNQIAILLNPLETSFQSGQLTSITVSTPTIIYNQCDSKSGAFGNQIISMSQQSFNRWSTPTNGQAFQNKYIFSDSSVQGQQFYLFSKPFNLPFKISDVIYMTSSAKYYCFVNPPQNIQDELSNLKEKNIMVVNDSSLCTGAATVCFDESGCDINVNYDKGEITKGSNSSTISFYGDALMYGAIFSDTQTYECQLKRLMMRESQLAFLYQDKSNTITQIGCSSGLGPDLIQLGSSANSLKSSAGLNNLVYLANKIQNENGGTQCPLW